MPLYVVIISMLLLLGYLFSYGNRDVLRFLNYLFFASVVYFFFKSTINKLAFQIFGFTVCIFFIQMLTLPYADYKQILNQTGFLLAFVSLTTVVSKSNKFLNDELFEIIWRMLLFSMAVIMIAYLLNIASLKISYNHIFSDINSSIGVHKQYLGVIVALFTAAVFVQLDGKVRVFSIMLIVYLFFGIRSFVFGYIVFIVYALLSRSAVLRVSVYLIGLCGALAIILYKPVVFDFLLFDIRGIMLDAWLKIAHNNPFGIGIGGVDEYLTYEFTLNPKAYSLAMALDENYSMIDKDFNLLESDFMQLLVTVGPVLTWTYYVVSLEFIRKRFLLRWHTSSKLKRYAFISFSWFIFAGLFEDYMQNLFWWVGLIFLVGTADEDKNLIKKNTGEEY